MTKELPSNVIVRLLLPSDSLHYMLFRKQAAKESEWVNTMTTEKAKVLAESTEHTTLIATEVGAIIGTLVLHQTPEALAIDLIAVLKDEQGNGLSQRLLGEAIDLARAAEKPELRLTVHHRNYRARAFYEREGFELVSTSAQNSVFRLPVSPK